MKSVLHELFPLCFRHDEGALIDGERGILHASSRCPAQIGLWSLATQTSRAYFKLEPGDILLVKDPSAGGPGRDSMTLLQRLESGPDLELYHARNFTAPSSWGQRLPPVPLRTQGELNQFIVSALGEDSSRLNWAVERQDEFAERWRRCWRSWNLGSRTFKTFLEESKQDLQNRLHEIPEGEASSEGCTRFEETIRLKILSEDGKIRLETDGCSSGKRLWLPMPAAASSLRGCLMEWFGWRAHWDSSLEELIPFRCPQQILLNARSQDPCDEGLEELPGLLRQLMLRALQDLDPQRGAKEGLSAPTITVHLLFSGGRGWKVQLPAGRSTASSEDAAPHLLPQITGADLCLEDVEKKAPLRIQRVAERNFRAAPVGENRRHRGLTMTLELLEPARLRWSGADFAKVPKTKSQQKPQVPGEVVISKSDRPLEPCSFHELPAGTVIQISSGAYGF